MTRAIFLLSLVLVGRFAGLAETTTFRNEGLKNETVVTLSVDGKKVNGSFLSSEYGEEPAVEHRFTGEIIPTPNGKRGVYMRIRFTGEVPYSAPPATKVLKWYLRIVDHRAHLFIPMQERSYEERTPKWIVSDVEFVPSG